jgi:hypothetical protein
VLELNCAWLPSFSSGTNANILVGLHARTLGARNADHWLFAERNFTPEQRDILDLRSAPRFGSSASWIATILEAMFSWMYEVQPDSIALQASPALAYFRYPRAFAVATCRFFPNTGKAPALP